MKITRVSWKSLGIVLAGSLLQVGCSTYGGQKLGELNKSEVVPKGIPYSLVRPEFVLTRTAPPEGQKKSVYALAVSYEPDPSQRYSLNIDPALFADPNFTVKLAAGGALIGTKAGFTEQITPTLTAIGSIASSIIGAAAKGIFDKDSIRNAIKGKVDSAAKVASSPCAQSSRVRRYGLHKVPAEETVAQEIDRRIDEFSSDSAFAELFSYLDDAEKQCLQAALKALENDQQTLNKVATEAYEKRRKAYLGTYPDDSLFAGQVDHAVATDDSELFKALAEKKTDGAGATIDSARLEKRADLVADGRRAAKAKAATKAVDVVREIVELGPAAWRARYVLYLDRELDDLTLAMIRYPAQEPAFREDQLAVYRARARALAVPELQARKELLQRFLSRIVDKPAHGGMAPATAEFATARAELDETLKQIEARHARVLADGKPEQPPPPPPLAGVPVVLVNSDFVNSAEGDDKPPYVMVLKEVK